MRRTGLLERRHRQPVLAHLDPACAELDPAHGARARVARRRGQDEGRCCVFRAQRAPRAGGSRAAARRGTASSWRSALSAKHATTAPVLPAPARSAGACALRRIQWCTGRYHVRQNWLTGASWRWPCRCASRPRRTPRSACACRRAAASRPAAYMHAVRQRRCRNRMRRL